MNVLFQEVAPKQPEKYIAASRRVMNGRIDRDDFKGLPKLADCFKCIGGVNQGHHQGSYYWNKGPKVIEGPTQQQGWSGVLVCLPSLRTVLLVSSTWERWPADCVHQRGIREQVQ